MNECCARCVFFLPTTTTTRRMFAYKVLSGFLPRYALGGQGQLALHITWRKKEVMAMRLDNPQLIQGLGGLPNDKDA